MKWILSSIVFFSLHSLNSYATIQDSLHLLNQVLEQIQNNNFLHRPNHLECVTIDQVKPLQNKSELINFICNHAAYTDDASLKKELIESGSDKILAPRSVDELIKSFRKFHDFNSTIPQTFNVTTPNDWQLGNQEMTEYPCQYRVKKFSENNFHQMNFKNLSFVGSAHFRDKKPEDIADAQIELTSNLNSIKPDVLLIEGKEYGKPIECGAVLTDAFSEDKDLNSEMRSTIKYGFWNQIPLIPADNQKIDDTDLTFLGNNEFAKKEAIKKFDFINTLHFYHDLLTKNRPDALATALKNANNQMTEKEFQEHYLEINQRTLSIDASEIKKDFSPSIVVSPIRASNRIADFQNEIRNKALLKAIQISSLKYSRPTVIYGSGHLGQVGESLESYLGKPTNVDFDAACKE